ncbi:MAG: hypothetical protein H6858_02215 [Rhodospirillales bacterium]|nr:hypothetical protein [Alphaproteobacteria bacterium]MCB9976399.1 hypothetical protein [Rhodospirillales bacterium]
MKKTFFRHLAVLLVMALSAGTLIHISQSVNRAEKKLARLDLSISNEKETERVLEAEWSMLNSPERIESLAKKYLDLGLPQPSQLVSGSESLEGAEIAGQAGLIPASAEMTKAGPFPAVIPRKPPHGVSPSNEQENSPE